VVVYTRKPYKWAKAPIERIVGPRLARLFDPQDKEAWIERARLLNPRFRAFLDEALQLHRAGGEAIVYCLDREDIAEAVIAWILDRARELSEGGSGGRTPAPPP